MVLVPKKKPMQLGADKCTQAVNTHNELFQKVTFVVYLKLYADSSIYLSEKTAEKLLSQANILHSSFS